MFTGIVERTSRVAAAVNGPKFRRLTIVSHWNDLRDGESIAVNGVCLTVAEIADGLVGFDVIKETLDRTNLGLLVNGDEVHVERPARGRSHRRPFRAGACGWPRDDRQSKSDGGGMANGARAPEDLARFLAPKGSVALDGISLTIASLNGNRFEVALIPTTLKLTAIGQKPIGWPCNFEADILTKSVVNYLEAHHRSTDD